MNGVATSRIESMIMDMVLINWRCIAGKWRFTFNTRQLNRSKMLDQDLSASRVESACNGFSGGLEGSFGTVKCSNTQALVETNTRGFTHCVNWKGLSATDRRRSIQIGRLNTGEHTITRVLICLQFSTSNCTEIVP